jgi:NAD(P)H-hydrate epimerase
MHRGTGEDSDLEFTPEALRGIDRAAVERYAMPSIVLMENAARGLAAAVLAAIPSPGARRVLIVCGRGNNAGDGLACARHLHNAGVEVEVVLVEPDAQFAADCAVNLRIVRAMGTIPVHTRWPAEVAHAPVVVDALLGTGVRPPVQGVLAEAIDAINGLGRAGSVVVAADVPSGLDALSGEGLSTGGTPAVVAARTVTFVGPKPGFRTRAGRGFVGVVEVVPIGCPVELVREFGNPRTGLASSHAGTVPGAHPARPADGR